MVRWLGVGVILLGCGAGREIPPSNQASGQAIVVRMAKSGELTHEPPTDPILELFGGHCPVSGAAARDLVPALQAFIRERSGRASFRTRLVLPGAPEPPPIGVGYEVTIEPRTQIGMLEVADRWEGGGGSWQTYCLHVRQERGETIVLVELRSDVISEREDRSSARIAHAGSATAAMPVSR